MLKEKLKRVCAITSLEEMVKFEINTLVFSSAGKG